MSIKLIPDHEVTELLAKFKEALPDMVKYEVLTLDSIEGTMAGHVAGEIIPITRERLVHGAREKRGKETLRKVPLAQLIAQAHHTPKHHEEVIQQLREKGYKL